MFKNRYLIAAILLCSLLSIVCLAGKTRELKLSSNPYAKAISKNKAYIYWETNMHASSRVDWGESKKYEEVAGGEHTDEHKVLLTGLKAGMIYHYKVTSKTESGQSVSSSDNVFETLAPNLVIRQANVPPSLQVGNSYTASAVIVIEDQPLEGPYSVKVYREAVMRTEKGPNTIMLIFLAETTVANQEMGKQRTVEVPFVLKPLHKLGEGGELSDAIIIRVEAQEKEKTLADNEIKIPVAVY